MSYEKKQFMKEVAPFGFPVFRRAGKQAAAEEEDDKSMTYQEIETDIYGDTNAFKVTSDYALKFKLKGKDDGETIEK